MIDRKRARELAAEYLGKGDPTGWFEVLYKEAEEGKSFVPWADRGANPGLLEFWHMHPLAANGKKALVIACGLGDDAEQLSAWGFDTTAFDISETAIRGARNRFIKSSVKFGVADLFQPPAEWQRALDSVFESITEQVLLVNDGAQAILKIAS